MLLYKLLYFVFVNLLLLLFFFSGFNRSFCMKYIGVYVSAVGGLVNVVICVVEIDVIVFVLFIKN